MSHIPVTVSRRERNSQEDAHGVAGKENTPHEPVTADYSTSAGRIASERSRWSMEPVEIIYNGYIEERENIDTEETNEAAE